MSEYEDSEYEDSKYSISLKFSLNEPGWICDITLDTKDKNEEIGQFLKQFLNKNEQRSFKISYKCKEQILDIISYILRQINLNKHDIIVGFYNNNNTIKEHTFYAKQKKSTNKIIYFNQIILDYIRANLERIEEANKLYKLYNNKKNQKPSQENQEMNIDTENNSIILEGINIDLNNQHDAESNSIKISETERMIKAVDKSCISNEQAKEELLAQNKDKTNKDKTTINIISETKQNNEHYNSNTFLSCLNCCNYNYYIPNSKNEIQVPQ